MGDSKDQVWGLTSIVFASICSGFSNCYFEKILKEKTSPQPPSDSSPPPPLSSHHQNQASSPTPSLWIRNIQLTIYGLIPNLIFLSYDFYSISLSEPSSSRVEAGVGVEGYFPLEGEVDFKDFFFPSYSPLLWLLVLIQITGGLLTGTFLVFPLLVSLTHSPWRTKREEQSLTFLFPKNRFELCTIRSRDFTSR